MFFATVIGDYEANPSSLLDTRHLPVQSSHITDTFKTHFRHLPEFPRQLSDTLLTLPRHRTLVV